MNNKPLIAGVIVLAVLAGTISVSAAGYGGLNRPGMRIMPKQAVGPNGPVTQDANPQFHEQFQGGCQGEESECQGLQGEGKGQRNRTNPVPNLTEEELEAMKAEIPDTYEATEELIGDDNASVIRQRGKFLMWTHDGDHIMWGRFGNGFFIGGDNLGIKAWGIYGNGYFAGFYNGEFFHGRYTRGAWKAVNLFGEEYSYGRLVTFPGWTTPPFPPYPYPLEAEE